MPSDRPDAWMPFYIGDYLADTMHLTTLEHGAYDLLLFAAWPKRGVLRITKAIGMQITKLSADQWDVMEPTLREFFKVDGEIWTQGRTVKEYQAAETRWAAQKHRTANATAARQRQAAERNDQRNDERNDGESAVFAPNVTTNVTLSSSPSPSPSSSKKDSVVPLNGSELPLNEPDQPKPIRRKGVKGTRIPNDWKPSEDEAAYGRKLGVDVRWVAADFRDYWLQRTDAKAMKADWSAAWRTWCRRQAKGPQAWKANGHPPGST